MNKVTILFPGSFKPIHAGHIDLISRYSADPAVNEIKILVGPGVRDDISQDIAVKIISSLIKDPKIIIEEVKEVTPILAAYKFIETAPAGTYALASSTKEDDYKRVKKFTQQHGVGGKYFDIKPKNVKVIELLIDANPLLYRGRNDQYENTPLCASILREDIKKNDFFNFCTNYPNYDYQIIHKVWNMLKINQ